MTDAEHDHARGAGRPRLAILAGVALAHVAVLMAVAIERTQPPRAAGAAELTMFDVSEPAPASRPVVARRVPAPIPTVRPAPVARPTPLPVAMDPAAADALIAGDCDLTAVVQRALRDDVRARAAALDIPADARSVANAVMLWDGRWLPAGRTPTGARALAAIRAATLAGIAAAPAECRAREQTGPRLISVIGPPDVTLVVGSGRWRWGDLAADGLPDGPGTADAGEPTFISSDQSRRPVRHVPLTIS